MTGISAAREQFVAAIPELEAIACDVEKALRELMQVNGISALVKARVKDVSSFVSKSIRKGYTDPWIKTTDKVGARVTVDQASDIAKVVDLIRDHFHVLEVQDKARALDEDRFGYAGVHLQIARTTGAVSGECEIQVRSAAQNLWSEMSHRLLYKPGVQLEQIIERRALVRLAALMEIFDEEVARAMSRLTAAPGYEIEELISTAQSQFYKFANSSYDRTLSRYVIASIGSALPSGTNKVYADRLNDFVESNNEKLASIFRRYEDASGPALLHQPESIVIFELIATSPHQLEETWSGHLPSDELDGLRAIWG